MLKLKEDELRRVIILLYMCWSERCRVREGESPKSHEQLVLLVASYAEEWAPKPASREPVSVQRKQKWSRPPSDFIKINCDGAFAQEHLTGGWGYVMRGPDGQFIGSGYGRLNNVMEASHAEVIAALQALQRASDMGMQNVILETDAAAVVDAVNSHQLDRGSASGLLWELKESLCCNFRCNRIVFNPRSCNQVAHSLAASGAGLNPGAGPTVDSIPTCECFCSH